MQKSDLVEVRDFKEEDRNFIYASWLRGLYYGETWYSEVDKQIFMENYHKVLEYILSKAKVSICCLREDKDTILGYSVTNKVSNVLHWVFVKKAWRKIGIAKSLVSQDVKIVTHLTKIGRALIKDKGLTYNPFLIT